MTSTSGVSQWLTSIDDRIVAIDWSGSVALALVPLDLLHVDPAFQRSAESPRGRRNIEEIKHAFDAITFGAIAVNIRNNMELSVVDGQHRVVAMREMGRGHEAFPALVSFGATVSEEAHRFRTQDDNSKPLSLIEKYYAGLSDEEDHESRAIANILAGFGYEIAQSTAPGRLRCIASIRAVYSSAGESHIRVVLGVIEQSWGDDVGAVDNKLFRGLSRFLIQYGAAVDRNRLIRGLGRQSPRQVRETATKMANGVGTDYITATVNALVGIYNVRQPERSRLPPFMLRTPFDAEQWIAERRP